MPVLDNQRHEKFAQCLAKGMSAAKAFVEAGYAANDSNSSRLSGNERVRARVVELQEKAAARTVVSIETITAKLARAQEFAVECGAASALVSAILGEAKIHGLLIDKTELKGQIDIADQLTRAKRRANLIPSAGFGAENYGENSDE